MKVYLLPRTLGGPHNELGPAYQDDYAGQPYTTMPFGKEPWCIVGFPTLTVESESALALHADVLAFPDTDSATWTSAIGGQLAALQAFLEAANIPANWIQATYTWRSVVLILGAMTQFFQRFGSREIGGLALFGGSVTLGTRWNQLPTDVQNKLRAAATSMGFDTTGLSGNSTLRVILKSVADQWGVRDLILSGRLL